MLARRERRQHRERQLGQLDPGPGVPPGMLRIESQKTIEHSPALELRVVADRRQPLLGGTLEQLQHEADAAEPLVRDAQEVLLALLQKAQEGRLPDRLGLAGEEEAFALSDPVGGLDAARALRQQVPHDLRGLLPRELRPEKPLHDLLRDVLILTGHPKILRRSARRSQDRPVFSREVSA
ncbi:MAG TPA: hypothetical protein VF756_00555 [Thermoanaerobaculia bacterium]